MKEQKLEEEVVKILDEIPNGRRALLENYDNLLNVAEYCNNNYVQSGDSSMKALNETKNFATQSLASVAYQINTLASSILSLLDAQTNQLHHMESSINLIGQKVEMHKEKVSRREIGVFTAVKQVPRSHKVLPLTPSSTATRPRPPYSRQPINYQQLDGVGHGMKEVLVATVNHTNRRRALKLLCCAHIQYSTCRTAVQNVGDTNVVPAFFSF
eukprot:XP_011619679.1 PREDICTED: abl interactor 1-like isoform X2 [Takifugu rubripes]